MKKVYVGCCGFPLRREDYYEKFSLVEVQESFYKLPKIETAKRWRESFPPNFQFSLKAFQAITHPVSSPTWRRSGLKEEELKRLKDKVGFFQSTKEVFEAWRETEEIAKILKTKVILFQCPASFKPIEENIQNLRKFFRKINSEKFIFVWEPRGEWEDFLIKSLCEELNLVHCVDPFKQRPVFGRLNYFRLHGRPGYNLRYEYSDNDLKELLNFCDKRENYVLFNNLSMFPDALRFKELCEDLKIT